MVPKPHIIPILSFTTLGGPEAAVFPLLHAVAQAAWSLRSRVQLFILFRARFPWRLPTLDSWSDSPASPTSSTRGFNVERTASGTLTQSQWSRTRSFLFPTRFRGWLRVLDCVLHSPACISSHTRGFNVETTTISTHSTDLERARSNPVTINAHRSAYYGVFRNCLNNTRNFLHITRLQNSLSCHVRAFIFPENDIHKGGTLSHSTCELSSLRGTFLLP